ncbi:MAG: glycosyltransferase family 9 protein [Gallionella sp.]
MTEQFRNILLIQLGDIGDVVLTTPTIRAVKETYPDARISILVRKPFGSLLIADPHLYEVVETTKTRGSLLSAIREHLRFALRLRRAQYDLVIDLRTGDRGALLCFLTGAPMRVGQYVQEKQIWRNFVFTKVLYDTPVAALPVHPGADQSLRIVRVIGIDTPDSTPKIYLSSPDQIHALELLNEMGVMPKKFITINPFSRWKYKEWSNDKWGEVIDRTWETYQIPAVLIGSPEESIGCQEIVMGREGRAFNLAGKTSLGELAAVISTSALHLGVDSAAPHIAAAVGVPTVTIHGPTDWRSWRIVDNYHKVVSPLVDCLPCNKTGCSGSGKSKCLDDLLVPEPVVYETLKLLAAFLKV